MLFDSFMVWQQIVLWWTTGSPLSLIGIEVRSLYIQLKDNLTSGLNVQYYIDNSGGTKASILLFNNFSCHCITVEMCLEWKARKKRTCHSRKPGESAFHWNTVNFILVKGMDGFFFHSKCLSLLTWHRGLFSSLTKAHSYPRVHIWVHKTRDEQCECNEEVIWVW